MGETLEFQPRYHSEEEQPISNIEVFKKLLEGNDEFDAFVHLSPEYAGQIASCLGDWAKNKDVTTIESEIMQGEVLYSPKATAELRGLRNTIEIKGDQRDGLYLELRGPGRGPETFKNIKTKKIGENTFCLTPNEETFNNSLETGGLDEENGRGLYICAQLAVMGGYNLDFYRETVDGKDYHGFILRSQKEEEKKQVA